MHKSLALVTAAAVSLSPLLVSVSADAVAPKWSNCDTVNKRLPHGVGRANARDHTSGTPVRTFKRSTPLYQQAMRANKRLDGDKDGIACEQA